MKHKNRVSAQVEIVACRFRSVAIASGLLCGLAAHALAQSNAGSGVWGSGLGLTRYGSSGLLSVPTADVAPAGSFDFAINRAFDPIFDANSAPRGRNAMFVATPYDNVEIGGRLAEYTEVDPISRLITKGSRDLSGNIKVQMVRMPDRATRAAVGIQDVAGGAVALRGFFGVITHDMGPLSITGGAIKRASGGRSGFMGGVKVGIIEPLYLLADVDPYQRSIGARANIPLKFVPGAPELSTTLARSFPRFTANRAPGIDIQLALRFALGQAKPQPDALRSMGRSDDLASAQWPSADQPLRADDGLQTQLRALGFDAVAVRADDDRAVASVQNSSFKHSHFDGLSVALTALARGLPTTVKDIFLVLTVQGVPVAKVAANRAAWLRFADGGQRPSFGSELRLTSAAGGSTTKVLAGQTDVPFSVRFDPVVRTFFGTDLGATEAAASVRATTIWDGLPLAGGRVLASASVTTDPLTTDAFDQGRGYFGLQPKSGLTHAMVHWAGWTGSDLFHLASVGRYDKDYTGASIESHWVNRRLPLDVDGTISLRAGAFRSPDATTNPLAGPTAIRNLAYARVSARGYIPSVDLTVEAGAGQFLAKDRGASVDVSRDFGDVSFGVTYRYTDRHYFGIQMGVPLTPRNNTAKFGPVRVEGSNHFIHSARTSYLGKGQVNAVIPTAARFADLPLEASLHLLDRNRISEAQWGVSMMSSRDFANAVIGAGK